jgi:ABC-type multidrug transport system ATPase subunit
VLKVSSLEKKLGSFSLSINDLCINSPGIYGLIGPNGCGKSTMAKLLCGVLQPDSGKIDISLDRLAVTMITQKPYIIDDTLYNNLAYPLRLRGVKPLAPLCEEYLEMTGFLERKKQRARELSGGEKQKLALLRAMIFQPRLIIRDEAMTDLDMDSLDFFEGMILERQKNDPVIWIVISHQLAQVRRLCDYIFFMNGGRVEAEGPTEELLHSPNPLVRRFLKHGVLEVGI